MISLRNHVKSKKAPASVFSVVFFTLASISLFAGNKVSATLLFLFSIGFMLVAFFRHRWLKIPNLVWFKFGILLGGIVAPLVMGFIFILVFFPIGICMRLLGHDPLSRNIDPTLNSYWIKRKASMQSMKRQF